MPGGRAVPLRSPVPGAAVPDMLAAAAAACVRCWCRAGRRALPGGRRLSGRGGYGWQRDAGGSGVLAGGAIRAGVPGRGGGPAHERAERPGRGRYQVDDRVRVPGPGQQGERDLPGGLAAGRVSEAAGDLDLPAEVAWRHRYQERLEPVAGMPDDVPGPDLPDRGARLGRPVREGGGETGDPCQRRGPAVTMTGQAARSGWPQGGAGSIKGRGDGGGGQGAQFPFRGSGQGGFPDAAEGRVRHGEPQAGPGCVLDDLAAGRGQAGLRPPGGLRPRQQPGAGAVGHVDLDAQAVGRHGDRFPGSAAGLAGRPGAGIRCHQACGRVHRLAVHDGEQVREHQRREPAQAGADVVVGERHAGLRPDGMQVACGWCRDVPPAGGRRRAARWLPGGYRRYAPGRDLGCGKPARRVRGLGGVAGPGRGRWLRRGHGRAGPTGVRGTAGQGLLRGARAPVRGAGVIQLGV